MINVITEMKNEARAAGRAEGRAAGRAEGRAEGRARALTQSSRAFVANIRRMADSGVLTRAAARTQVQDLIDAGAIPPEIGRKALVQLA